MLSRAAILFLIAFGGVAQAQFLTPVVSRPFESVFDNSGLPVPFFTQTAAVNYDLGGQGIAYNVPSPGCSGVTCAAGARTDAVNIKSSTFGSGFSFQLSFNTSPNAYNYTINVNQPGPYIITLWAGSASAGGSWNVLIDNTLVANVPTPNTGSYSTLAASPSPAFNATIGTHVLRLAWGSGDSLGSAGDLVAWQGGTASSCPCLAGNAANVCVNNPTVAANQPVSISWVCGPSDTGSFVALLNSIGAASAGQANSPWGNTVYWKTTGGAAAGSMTLPAPNAKVDRDEQWVASLELSSGSQVAQSSLFTVSASISPPAPTASLPVSVSADPFTPAHTNTVCASGCDFTDLGSAVHNAHVNSWDNVKINISAGDYPNPQFAVPASSDYPAHLWIRGISPDGKTFPHIFGSTPNGGVLFQTGNVTTGVGLASLTLDNLEIGPWNWKAMIPGDNTLWTLRNVYVHDNLDGLESGNNWDSTINFYNVVFARNGGGSGPDHNVYVGAGNLGVIVNVLNSVFEQANLGHSFKTRAKQNNLTCSMFLLNADNVYLGSQDIDIDWGVPIINKSLLLQGNGAGLSWNNQNAWDNEKFAVDNEAGRTAVPLLYNEVVTNTNMVNDQSNNKFWPMVLGQRFTGPNPVPATWSGNNFVWTNTNSRDLSGNGTTPGGEVTTQSTFANIADVNLDNTNHTYTSWSAAGFSVAPNAEPYGWRDFLPMMPSGCTDPVGLVKIPAS